MEKEKLKKLLNVKVIYLIICFLVMVLFICLRSTHAYYNYSTGPVPIFTGKVGNFTGRGDTSPLKDKNTDINLLFMVQDLMIKNGYYIAPSNPIAMSGYKLNKEKSNCIPKDATYTMDGENVFTVDSNGLVKVIVKQSKPNQVVCRIYYDMSGASNDILVFALVENINGTITHGDKTYAFESELPTSGYTDYECKNKDTATKVNFDGTKFNFESTGPNVCYAYFNKS